MNRVAVVGSAAGAALVGILVAGLVGGATAQTPATTTTTAVAAVRTVAVQGVGNASIDPNADGAVANAAYRTALAVAVNDAGSKAGALATDAGATSGPVQDIAEDGGEVDCTDTSGDYEDYNGVQPDFGSDDGTVTPSGVASVGAQAPNVLQKTTSSGSGSVKSKKKKKHPKAHAAQSALTCTVQAEVSVSYLLQ
ncbi:MAG TPA: hypothetical protein VHX88_14290 [Solirubrobacteraceae bacterium]|jgi:hypothetical protein|nr:hypothetical protein [Solirubrobacteraceae bacterium]